MTNNKPSLRKLVSFYVYLMYFLTAVVLFGMSTASLMGKVMLWLFCFMVYRSLNRRYTMTKTEKQYLRLYENQGTTFISVLQTAFVCFCVWAVTYTFINNYIPVLRQYENYFALANSLIYSFFYFVKSLNE